MSQGLLYHGFGVHGYTHSFARYVLELGPLMTPRDVARHLGGQLGPGQKHPKGISANLDADKDEPRRLQEDLRQL